MTVAERWTVADTLRAADARWKQGWRAGLLMTLIGLSLVMALERLPFAPVDWRLYQEVLTYPRQAYRYDFFNPPWTVWLLWPFAWLPYQIGAVRLATLATFLGLARARGAEGMKLALLASSAPLLFLVANGNIDFLPGLAFLIADKSLALPLLLIKPQTGVFAVLAWLRRAGWRGAARLVLPTLGLLAVSLLVYGWWPRQALENIARMQGVGLANVSWNTSLFPWGVPFGLYFAWRAWREADDFHGVTAAWLLSPYTPLYSLTLWYALFLGRAKKRWVAALAWMILWLVYIVYFALGWGAR